MSHARALQTQLAAAFSVPELRELAAEVGADAAQIWGEDATVNAAALALVEWMRRRERLCDLANAAAAARPQNAQLHDAARLLPLMYRDSGQRGDVKSAPPVVEVERRAQVTDPGIEYGNGVQRTLGRVESQIDALRSDVAGMRQELAAQRADSEQRAVTQRVHLWLTLLAVAGTLGTAAALVTHMWP